MNNLTPDEHKIARALLYLAIEAPEIWKEMELSGLQHESAIVRRTVAEYSEESDKLADLEEYWVEFAKERLSMLRGPLNAMTGKSSLPLTYSSLLLHELRRSAASLPYPGSERIAQIHPALVKHLFCAEGLKKIPILWEKVRQIRQDSLMKIVKSSEEIFIDTASPNRRELIKKIAIGQLPPKDFSILLAGRNFLNIVGELEKGKFIYNFLVDLEQINEQCGPVRCSVAVTLPSQKFSENNGHVGTIAYFEIDYLDPYFSFASSFDNALYKDFYYLTKTISSLASIIFYRLNDILITNN